MDGAGPDAAVLVSGATAAPRATMWRVGRKARNRPQRRPSPEELRQREERACKRKTRYLNQREALEAQALVRLRYGHDKGIYRCDHCGGWHLGGRPLDD